MKQAIKDIKTKEMDQDQEDELVIMCMYDEYSISITDEDVVKCIGRAEGATEYIYSVSTNGLLGRFFLEVAK